MIQTGLRHAAGIAAVLMVSTATAACGGSHQLPSGASAPATPAAPASSGPRRIADPYSPAIDPAAFSTKIDNPYLPLIPGTRTVYQAAGTRRTTTEVTRQTKKVMGVDTVVVHDVVTVDGKTEEDTFDWYAQDRDGNVWYFGEATKSFEEGGVDTSGSFEAGVDGALPGIVMLGRPQVGDQYRQEFAKGVAEDTGEVVSLTGTESTPLTGPTRDLLVTKDRDLLDPSSVESKFYARGIGLVLTAEATEREEAIAVEHF